GPFTSDVQQVHIHFGKSRDSGGIVVWQCQTTAKLAPAQVAALTPTCPTLNPTATVTGNITTDNVLAVAGQKCNGQTTRRDHVPHGLRQHAHGKFSEG